MWNGVKSAATSALNPVKTVINGVKSAIDAVIGAVDSLISKLRNIKVPKIHIPGLPKALQPSSVSPTPAGLLGATPRVARPAARASSSGGGSVIINVTGAIDPEATARQIRRVLDGHSRRVGLAS
jgi:hypothetical protein